MNKAITVVDLDIPGATPVDFGSDEVAAATYTAQRDRRTLTTMFWEDGTLWHGVSDPRDGSMVWTLPKEDMDEFFGTKQKTEGDAL